MGNETIKVGFAGLGAMGLSMARNLHRAGLLAAVWNRSPEKANMLADETGVVAATSPEALARVCDVLVLCVSADQDVLEMVTALQPGIKPGAMVIDCSTVSRDTAQQAAQRLAQMDAGFLDAPVSGGTEGAKQGTLTIMVGGELADFERARPVFEAMGSRIERMGPVGAGQATKAVNQVLCAGINQAVCEALRFGESLDLPMDQVIDMIGSGAAGNWFINHRGKTMMRDHYAPGFKLALHHKDLKICEDMAAKTGADIPLSRQTREEYEPLMEQGFGGEDISALYRRRRQRRRAG